MKRLGILLSAAVMLAATTALADKPAAPPGQQKGAGNAPGQGYGGQHGELPYGLQKKLQRTGELPPGWEKKLQVGSVLEPDLYERSTRVSTELSTRLRLPTRPEGTSDVRIEDRVVRLRDQDRRITDVFELRQR